MPAFSICKCVLYLFDVAPLSAEYLSRSVAIDRRLWSDHRPLERNFARHGSDHRRSWCIWRYLGRSSSGRRGSIFLKRGPSCATTRLCHFTAHWEDAPLTFKGCIVQSCSAIAAACRHVGRWGRREASTRDPNRRSASSAPSRAKRDEQRSAHPQQSCGGWSRLAAPGAAAWRARGAAGPPPQRGEQEVRLLGSWWVGRGRSRPPS